MGHRNSGGRHRLIVGSILHCYISTYFISVEFQINKFKAEDLKTLHRVLFGKITAVSLYVCCLQKLSVNDYRVLPIQFV